MVRIRINDPALIALALAASFLGLVFIFDAGYARSLASGRGMIPGEFKTQLMMFVVSIVAGGLMSKLPGDKWQKASKLIWFLAFVSVFLPEIPGLAHRQNGADRWFKLPFLPPIQPAEFVKVAVIIYLAGLFAKRKAWEPKPAKDWAQWLDRNLGRKLKRCLPALWIVIACVVIEKEPDMGTAAVIAATAFALFVVGGVSKKTLIAGSVAGVLLVGWLVTHESYRMERIRNHGARWSAENMDDAGWQTVQSEIGLAAGGLIGVGPGAGRAKHVLPAATTDFVSATIGEEFGLLGMWGVLAVLGGLVFRLFHLAKRAADPFAALYLSGFGAWIAVQTSVNVMMANGLLPAIGIPMPFVSSGGSSLIALWMGIGIANSVLVRRPVREEAVETDRDRWGHGRARLSGA